MINDFSRNYTRTNIKPISDLAGLAAREGFGNPRPVNDAGEPPKPPTNIEDALAREQIARTLAARERIESIERANRYLALKRYNVWWRRALRVVGLC